MKSIRKIILVVMAVLMILPLTALAAENTPSVFYYDVSRESLRAGERLEITVSYDGKNGTGVAAFVVDIEYDSTALQYIRTNNEEAVKNGHNSTNATQGKVSSVFTSKEPKRSDLKTGKAFTYVFEALTEAAITSEVNIKTSQIVGGDGNVIEGDYSEAIKIVILPPKSEDSLLYSLSADEHELDPSFSPVIFSYNMIVPYEVESLVFDTECAENAVCRVNRKNLGTIGSDVDFVFTITAEDGKTVSKYTVTVHREEKPEKIEESSGSPNAAGGTKVSKTPSSKATSGKAKTNSSPKTKAGTEAKRSGSSEVSEILTESATEERISPTIIFHQGDYPAFMSGALIALIALTAGVGVAFLFLKAYRRKKGCDSDDVENE